MKLYRKYILLFLVFILCFSGCVKKEISYKELVNYYSNIKSYSCSAVFDIQDDKQHKYYVCKLFYDSEKGSRIDIGTNRVHVYKNDNIYVKDNQNSSGYVLNADFDKVFSMALINKYLDMGNSSGDLQYEVDQDKGLQNVAQRLSLNNLNLSRAVLTADISSDAPGNMIIYDNNGKTTITINYCDFRANVELAPELFEAGPQTGIGITNWRNNNEKS